MKIKLGGQEMAINCKKHLTVTIEVNLARSLKKATQIVVTKIFVINLSSQQCFVHHLQFHIFFHRGFFLGTAHFAVLD